MDHTDGTLPVSPIKIAQSMGIQVIDRRDAGDLLSLLGPEFGFKVDAPALSIAHSSGWRGIILDREYRDRVWRRMLLAHELAHFVLGHFSPAGSMAAEGGRSGSLFINSVSRGWQEVSCDLFAMGLLAPHAVLRAYGIRSYTEIARLCQIPPRAAHIISLCLTAKGYPSSHTESMVSELFSSVGVRLPDLFPRRLPEFFTDVSEEFI